MPRTLIAYSTVDGHTLKICSHLKQLLEQMGHTAELVEINGASAFDPALFDQIVIGASVRYGKHRPEVYRFIDANRQTLERKPSAFFSVNVVARKAGKDTPESNPYVQAFRRRTTWAPKEVGVFAGKIDYPRYGFMDRHVIRLIMWLTKGPTDLTTCVEFTDWQVVEKFAQRVSHMGLVGSSGAK
jgi:menaquinone-dependent protoporphyrinogen oxidase